MSEPLLKAILRLFAVAAREDEVTKQARQQIKIFLDEHLSQSAIGSYLLVFDDYVHKLLPRSHDLTTELARINEICNEINPDLTQKQKVVILLELIIAGFLSSMLRKMVFIVSRSIFSENI